MVSIARKQRSNTEQRRGAWEPASPGGVGRSPLTKTRNSTSPSPRPAVIRQAGFSPRGQFPFSTVGWTGRSTACRPTSGKQNLRLFLDFSHCPKALRNSHLGALQQWPKKLFFPLARYLARYLLTKGLSGLLAYRSVASDGQNAIAFF